MARAQAPEPQSNPSFAQALTGDLTRARAPLLEVSDFRRDATAITQFYALHANGPVWFKANEISRQGIALLQALRGADNYGLRPQDYDGTTLIYHAIDLITNPSATPTDRAELDLSMTTAAARMIRHLHFGRIDPRTAGFRLQKPRAPFDLAAALDRLANADDFDSAVSSVEPSFGPYQLMKQILHRYRLLAVDKELTDLPDFKGKSIKLGQPYSGIPALTKLLIAVGDLPASATVSDTVLDEPLSEALKHFQMRHGLAIDGALGRKTLAALRTPLSHRVQQIMLTLERWRWLPEIKVPPIIVNIPQFRLFAFHSIDDRGRNILQMDVIVGKTYPSNQTPVFTADLKYVVFRPYWDVPSSILHKELLPEIRANLGYLDKHNLEIVSASDANGTVITPSPTALDGLENGTLRLRQRPGDDNSLGLVKLMLPNPYNVYLHSTPAHRLFNEPRRAFSHGCIRVSDPVALTVLVLRNEPGDWTAEKVEAAMTSTDPNDNNRHVFLSSPIPVFIVYGTAVPQENGDVDFFDDIYGHDAKLTWLLNQQLAND